MGCINSLAVVGVSVSILGLTSGHDLLITQVSTDGKY